MSRRNRGVVAESAEAAQDQENVVLEMVLPEDVEPEADEVEAKEVKAEPTEPQVGQGMWTTPRAEATKVEKVGFCIRKRDTGLWAPFASCMNGKGWNIRSDRFTTLDEAKKRAAENAARAGYRLGEWEETKGGAARVWLIPAEAETEA